MDAPSYEQLLLENQQLREENAQLKKRIEELERAAKRQAAPRALVGGKAAWGGQTLPAAGDRVVDRGVALA